MEVGLTGEAGDFAVKRGVGKQAAANPRALADLEAGSIRKWDIDPHLQVFRVEQNGDGGAVGIISRARMDMISVTIADMAQE